MLKKIIILVVIAVAVACYFIFDLGQYLNLETLQTKKQHLENLYKQNSVFFIIGFFLIYVISTSISIPGAAILTLSAGFIFGSIVGTIIVSFASAIGATIAMIIARTLLGQSLQTKYKKQLATINKGIENDGPLYLLSLRLIPIFPFFLINLLMGLTTMPVIKYYIFSQIGMLAGTFVYVNAGTALAEINQLSDILSPKIFLSFALLGLLPIIVKFVMSILKKIKQK